MATYLIDDCGKWWPSPSAELQARLGYPDPDFDLAGYAVRNLGHVEVKIDDARRAIAFRPFCVKNHAIREVMAHLSAAGEGPIVLRYFVDKWQEETLASPSQAIERLSSLANIERQRTGLPVYAAMRRSLTDLARPDFQAFEPLFRKWRVQLHRFGDQSVDFLVRYNMLSRTVIASRDSASREPVFNFIGDGFSFYEPDWGLKAIGDPIADQPDRDYGRWTSKIYGEVIDGNQAVLEDVDARIWGGPGLGTRHSRYSRLLLPWETTTGERIVTCVSFLSANSNVAARG
jgi:hypothetical protein